jgi:tetratricopeptide (TPR) repeat protein
MKMRIVVLAGILLAPSMAVAQDASEVQRFFEAGQYQRVLEATQPDSDPSILYTAAQSHQRLNETNEAMDKYGMLAGRAESDPWHFVGESGQQLIQDNVGEAEGSARRAVDMDGGLPEGHFQLGLVLAKRQQFAAAAAEFDKVTELQPSSAYAHYYGGLMHYRANRPDRMAIHFEQFLKLAPDAPEKPEVTQIMRTVRGR